MRMILVKSSSQTPLKTDGFRVLIDRHWPRRIRRTDLAIDLWVGEIAPSKQLCNWAEHAREEWHEFRRRYEWELLDPMKQRILRDVLTACEDAKMITLVGSEQDTEHNPATVLKGALERLDRELARKVV